jgi:hypothetical protein
VDERRSTQPAEQHGARRRHHVWADEPQHGPVLCGRPEDREDAVGVGRAAGRQCRAGARRRVVFSLENDGELLVFRASRTAFESIKRYLVLPEEMYSRWAQPAISGNRIFVKDASTIALWTLN